MGFLQSLAPQFPFVKAVGPQGHGDQREEEDQHHDQGHRRGEGLLRLLGLRVSRSVQDGVGLVFLGCQKSREGGVAKFGPHWGSAGMLTLVRDNVRRIAKFCIRKCTGGSQNYARASELVL